MKIFHLVFNLSCVAAIIGPLWQTFVTTVKVYEKSSVEGAQDSFDGRYDSDGAERSLESFVIQVCYMFLPFLFFYCCCRVIEME